MGEFERFLSNLQGLLDANESTSGPGPAQEPVARSSAGDAIDVELGRPGRATAVVSLKEAPAVEAFRDELVNGLIRVDTANQFLRLVNSLISRLLV